MSLTPTQWRDIVNASEYVHSADGSRRTGRYVALDKVQEILRKARRSNDQNALLWALYSDAIRLAGETLGGWTTEDIHSFMLGEYFGWERYSAFGMTRQKPKRRSSRLTKLEFSDYVAFVVQRFAEHSIILTLPDDKAA